QHDHRLFAVGATRAELAEALSAFPRGVAGNGVSEGKVSLQGARPLLYVFSGQGSQWARMGQQLYKNHTIFRAKLEECDALVRQNADWSLLDELWATEEASRLGETEFAQPSLFALQVGLVELFKSWGIKPQAVIGHSVGEIAAAHVAGAL